MRLSRTSRAHQSHTASSQRISLIQLCVYLGVGAILVRLMYWQLIKGAELQAVAQSQYTSVRMMAGSRGSISTIDGHVLVANSHVYTLFAQPNILKDTPEHVASQILPIITDPTAPEASRAAVRQQLVTRLSQSDKKWIALERNLSAAQKDAILDLKLFGVGLDAETSRMYPEASMAAQILGFVGKDAMGRDTGYFGIEGKLDLELKGKEGKIIREQDARGAPILLSDAERVDMTPGRDITLTIRRDLQFMLEEKLAGGIKDYGAVSGEAIIMHPKTGAILAAATLPKYDPREFASFDTALYKNPLAAEGYEPGSTFKVLTVAAGIDAGVINPDTPCSRCSSARKISGYTIKTWNDQYTPNISMTDALAKSDNTAMIFIAEQLGQDRFVDYVNRFMIGKKSGIELQEDAGTIIRQQWKHIDLATASFGQGIATTGLQMMRAVSAIANDGQMVRPRLVHAVTVADEQTLIQPEIVGQPISAETAKTVKEMMVHAAHTGEAKWAVLKDYSIAGKTGTAQIPVAGHYDQDKTIASFIGFAPAYDPQFIMLIKLSEPTSSQWASETAAPLWYDIARELFVRLNIPPDRNQE